MKKLLTVVAWLSGVVVLIGCRGYYGPMRDWDHMMYFGYGGMFMWLILLILIGLLIYVMITAGKTKDRASQTPMDILKERYAKGEISKEDFDRMKKDLES